MRFTLQQYNQAITALLQARGQLEPDGNCCAICGCSSHQAWECGFNPLVAVVICQAIAETSHDLHQQLHWLAGFESNFGVQVGPAKIQMGDD